MTLHTETIHTPHGTRYTCTIEPHNHPHIESVGSGWCESPFQALWSARWHYGLALSVSQSMSAKAQEARAA